MAAWWDALGTVPATARVSDLNLKLLWASLPLVGALLLAAVVISLAKRSRKRTSPERLTASEQLARFRTLYERGEMSPEEFERVRARLAERLRQEIDGRASAPMEIRSLEPEPPAGPAPAADGRPDTQAPPAANPTG